MFVWIDVPLDDGQQRPADGQEAILNPKPLTHEQRLTWLACLAWFTGARRSGDDSTAISDSCGSCRTQGTLLEVLLLSATQHGWAREAIDGDAAAAALQQDGFDPRCDAVLRFSVTMTGVD